MNIYIYMTLLNARQIKFKKWRQRKHCELKVQNEMVEINANVWETSVCGW